MLRLLVQLLKSVFRFQTLLCSLFWGEVFEPLLPGEQFIAVFQSGERRRALPLIQWQDVERLVEFPPGVGPATIHPDVLRQPVITLVAVRVEIPGKAFQKLLSVFRLPAGLVFIEHGGRPIIAPPSVQPHIALGLALLSWLVEHLEGGLVGIEHLTASPAAGNLQLDMICRDSRLTIVNFCVIMWAMASSEAKLPGITDGSFGAFTMGLRCRRTRKTSFLR